MRRVSVALKPSYDVVVGTGVLDEVAGLIGDRRRAVIVTQRPLVALAEGLGPLGSDGSALWIIEIGEGEHAKSLATVEELCREFARGRLGRGDVVVALGGGVVGDTAGFASAVYHRGIDVVQVPTTLLAQVDAAIGGKTAVNIPEGKNLVGAFHQPIGVIADTATLTTLPEREFRCGLGEVVKYALMPEGEAIRGLLDDHRALVRAREPDVLADLVTGCVAIKAQVVADDPEERTGRRATLNFGHTLGHALEVAGGHELAHGEAVAIGLVFATNLAAAVERVGPDSVDDVVALVSGLGLPTTVPFEGISANDLLVLMQRDKKASGGITFVLPGANGIEAIDDPPRPALDRAFRSVGIAADGDTSA
jgi:5-deoxy-5-amino-3-dehydroquinate synthase